MLSIIHPKCDCQYTCYVFHYTTGYADSGYLIIKIYHNQFNGQPKRTAIT